MTVFVRVCVPWLPSELPSTFHISTYDALDVLTLAGKGSRRNAP
jgi:hypothetical protein